MAEKLADILGKINVGVGKSIKICGFLELWDEVVDEKVRKNATAKKIWNRTLYVSTSSSVWANELTFLKRTIIKNFNEIAGETVITDIRFSAHGTN